MSSFGFLKVLFRPVFKHQPIHFLFEVSGHFIVFSLTILIALEGFLLNFKKICFLLGCELLHIQCDHFLDLCGGS